VFSSCNRVHYALAQHTNQQHRTLANYSIPANCRYRATPWHLQKIGLNLSQKTVDSMTNGGSNASETQQTKVPGSKPVSLNTGKEIHHGTSYQHEHGIIECTA
jgi:hypothetical protein